MSLVRRCSHLKQRLGAFGTPQQIQDDGEELQVIAEFVEVLGEEQ